MLGIGSGDPNSIANRVPVVTAVKAVKALADVIEDQKQKKAEQKKRVSDAWRSDSNSQASIKYSHGYGGR